MPHTFALFHPKSGDKPTPYFWVRFSYEGHVYRHSTFTRNEAAARRRGEVWRQRVIAFVDSTGSIPRDSEVPMPTAPEETPELVTITEGEDGTFAMRYLPRQEQVANAFRQLERAVHDNASGDVLRGHLSTLRNLLFAAADDGIALSPGAPARANAAPDRPSGT